MKLVQITIGALLTMVLSTAEVYKKECYGLVLGTVDKDKYNVMSVAPIQKASRDFKEVRPGDWSNIVKKNRGLFGQRILGDYHSHTQYGEARGGTRLSEEDIASAEHDLIFVIAANDVVKKRKWIGTQTGLITGTFDLISFSIKVYQTGDKVVPLPLICPNL